MGVEAEAHIDSRYFDVEGIAYIIQNVVGAKDVKAICPGSDNNVLSMMGYVTIGFECHDEARQLNFHYNHGFMGSHKISMASDFVGQNVTRTIAEIVGGAWTPEDTKSDGYTLFRGVYDGGKDTMFLLRWAISRDLIEEGTLGELQTAKEEFEKRHSSTYIR